MCLAEMAVLDGFLKLRIRVGDSLAKKKMYMLYVLMEEIRRAPVEVGPSLSHYCQGFIHPRWLALGFLPSTVGPPPVPLESLLP